MRKIKYLFLLGILYGCTTISQIDKNFSQVNIKDGVNEKEAVFIAQKQCVLNNVCNGNVRISTPEIRDDLSEWDIIFWSKDLTALERAYIVIIDKKTGEIIKSGITAKEAIEK